MRESHEMPAQLEAVDAYWSGKKYRSAKAKREYDFSQHEPYLVPHTKNPHLLYCTLTKMPVRSTSTDPRPAPASGGRLLSTRR